MVSNIKSNDKISATTNLYLEVVKLTFIDTTHISNGIEIKIHLNRIYNSQKDCRVVTCKYQQDEELNLKEKLTYVDIDHSKDKIEIIVEIVEVMEELTKIVKAILCGQIPINFLTRSSDYREEYWKIESSIQLTVRYRFQEIQTRPKRTVTFQVGTQGLSKFKHNFIDHELSDAPQTEQNDKTSKLMSLKPFSKGIQKITTDISQENVNPSFKESSNRISLFTNMTTGQPIILNSEETFLQYGQPYPYDTFCEGFFISGLPKTNAQIIPDSERFSSPCGHKICSILPAYRTEIISRYPQKEKDISSLELNQITSSLCYPYGIKICYNQAEKENIPPKNFYTVTTNASGKRNYVFVYHIFQKVDYFEFKKQYDFDPVKDQFLSSKIIQLIESCSKSEKKKSKIIEKEIEDQLETMSFLINSDFVYLPTAVCLVSKYPYTLEMEKCIEAFLTICSRGNYDPKEFLKHLIYELPVPPNNRRLLFHVPYNLSAIEIQGRLYRDLPIQGSPLHILFEYFSIDMIVYIHNLMLFEQKLLFIYNDYAKLTEISQAFIYLLYPMTWGDTYIPILSENLIKYIQSFMPFIMGIDENMLDIAKEYFDEESNIKIISVREKGGSTVYTSNEIIKSKKKAHEVPEFPKRLKVELVNDLKKCKKLKETCFIKGEYTNYNCKYYGTQSNMTFNSFPLGNINPHYKIDKFIRKIFIKSMIRIFGDYKKFVFFIDELAYFNQESFLDLKSEQEKDFLKDFTNTGIFRYFLQSKERLPYFSKMCVRFSNPTAIPLPTTDKKPIRRLTHTLPIADLTTFKNSSFSSRDNSRSKSVKKKATLPGGRFRLGAGFTGKDEENSRDTSFDVKAYQVSSHEGNSDSLSGSPTSDAKYSNYYQASYMVVPYFMNNNPMIGSDAAKIEEYLQELYSKSKEGHGDESYLKNIITSDLRLTYDHVNTVVKFNRYIIPGYDLGKSDKINPGMKRPNKENIMSGTTEEMEVVKKMTETIQDYMKNILTGETTQANFDSIALQTIFMSKIGRSCFSQIAYQSKFKDRKYHVLNDLGFDKLVQMIFSALLLGNNDVSKFEDVRLITKSLFCYYKILKTKEVYYLFQEFAKKKPFDIWLNDGFWMNWFIKEIKEREEDEAKGKMSLEDFYFMILLELSATMNDLNIDLRTQIFCILEKIANKFIVKDTQLLTMLEMTLIRQYKNKEKEKE